MWYFKKGSEIMGKVLAFDFGASSGRAVMGKYENGKIELEEIHRFDNDTVMVNGGFYWDVLRLFFEIKQGIGKAGDDYDSVGIDTWGVDYGLIDKNGNLMGNPYNYRDVRTEGMLEEANKVISSSELYKKSGNQIALINTLFQLLSDKKYRPYMLENADKMLFMPDLFNYFLTGKMYSERTIASTSQLLEPVTKDWNYEVIDKLGLDRKIFAELIDAGTYVGDITEEVCNEINVKTKRVIAVGGHDTASAVVAVPAKEKDFVFISCGTWSLFGTELEKPVISELSEKYNITNETGYNNTTRFLKNIIGLWLIQETKRRFRREGKQYSYNDMEQMARESKPFACFIDPDYPEFAKPGNIPERIREFCKNTNQYVPQTDGEIVRCIYESLAMKYKYTFLQLKECCNRDFGVIHMVGGGTKDPFLCQMAADAAGVPVIAGPVEGTAAGNIAVQLIANGEISDIWEARKVIADSFEVKEYTPSDSEAWDKAYEEFLKIL